MGAESSELWNPCHPHPIGSKANIFRKGLSEVQNSRFSSVINLSIIQADIWLCLLFFEEDAYNSERKCSFSFLSLSPFLSILLFLFQQGFARWVAEVS